MATSEPIHRPRPKAQEGDPMALRSFVTWRVSICSAAIPFIFATAAYAQEVSAGVTGTVTDPLGAAIVGAQVTAKDVDHRTAWDTKTNSEGIYAFPRLPA